LSDAELAECLTEDTIQAFADGRLDAAAVRALELHARHCADCGALVAMALAAVHGSAPRAAAPQGLSRGATLGRYVVLGPVGSGGMGDVFAAYDPELDRRVALKLLRSNPEGASARSRSRLLREAKAIAKLSHPNVVVVHDAGTYDERVFVAMEFVEGQTVAAWLAAGSRSQREILEVFAAAARGLGAAHAAGLVHRDFKPQNVMVGAGGKVRVMDFGLARTIGDEAADSSPAVADDASSLPAGIAQPVEATLTATGELLGTPLYMAPEQFRGQRTDARTDQFSFCVALYQALYGEHPFRADRLADLMTDVIAGTVKPPPPRTTVPMWLRRVLLRGLSTDPAPRWPSMDALLDALDHDPARTRRRRLAVGAGLIGAVAVAGVIWGTNRRLESPCQAGPRRLAAVWEVGGAGPLRDRVRKAFVATGLTYAAETWGRAEAVLDEYAGRWLGAYRDACEATNVRHDQSTEVLNLRMACLDERLTGLRALVDVLGTADKETVSRAVDAASALPPLDRCADVKQLLDRVEPPRDQATRARVDAIRERAAVVDALNATGKHTQALERGRALIGDARAIGYRPLIAELLQRLWTFTDVDQYAGEAAKDLNEAVLLALSSRRDDVAAQATALLSGIVGYMLARHEEGERWAELATALVDRLGPGYDRVRAWVLQTESAIALQANDLDRSLDYARQALALKQRVLPPNSPDFCSALTDVGEALYRKGDFEGALSYNAQARQVYVAAYGPSSPWQAILLSNRGEYLSALGRLQEALELFRQALAMWEAQLGPDHPSLGYPLTGIGAALWKLGRADEAVAPLERALRIREAHEPDPPTVAETRLALARALWDSGRDRARARRLAEQAREAYDRAKSTARPAQETRAWLAAHPQ
jgi:tetratricopeptide (TPR) repeat protein